MESQLFTVKVHLIFRLIIFTADIHFADTFYLHQFTLQLCSNAVSDVKVITIDFEVSCRLATHTATATTEEDLAFIEFWVHLQVFTHFITYLFQRNGTLFHTHQSHVERDDMATIGLHCSKCIIRIGLTYTVVTYLQDTLVTGHPLVCQFSSQFLSTFHTGTDRQLQGRTDTGIIR